MFSKVVQRLPIRCFKYVGLCVCLSVEEYLVRNCCLWISYLLAGSLGSGSATNRFEPFDEEPVRQGTSKMNNGLTRNWFHEKPVQLETGSARNWFQQGTS